MTPIAARPYRTVPSHHLFHHSILSHFRQVFPCRDISTNKSVDVSRVDSSTYSTVKSQFSYHSNLWAISPNFPLHCFQLHTTTTSIAVGSLAQLIRRTFLPGSFNRLYLTSGKIHTPILEPTIGLNIESNAESSFTDNQLITSILVGCRRLRLSKA